MPRTKTLNHRPYHGLPKRPNRQKIRTCPGCDGVFYRRHLIRHVRNDCGRMISVQELREQLLREANQHGFPVITYDTVDWIIERLAATRDGMYDLGDAGRDEGQDPEVEILDLTNIAEPADGIAAQSQGEPSTVEREVNAIIKKVADMDI